MNVSPNTLLVTLTPVDFDASVGSVIESSAWRALNQEIRKVSEEFGVTMIDVSSLSSNQPITRDGVYFTNEGSRIFVIKGMDTLTKKLGC